MKSLKCFKCKKVIAAASTSVISFYSLQPSEDDNHEYNFCSQRCLDDFYKDRIKFNAIVRNFNREPEND